MSGMLKAQPRGSKFIPPPRLPPPTPVVDVGDAEMRLAQALLFFAYRDFTNVADKVLEELDLGRAHHRALHFIGRHPGITVSGLLAILRITKQSLARVLNALVDQGYVGHAPGFEDRRLRLLTLTDKGLALEQRLFEVQRDRIAQAYRAAGPEAVQGFRSVMRAIMDEGARAYLDGTGSPEDT
jgi:DNA-binding MarR family transcriptional regulator